MERERSRPTVASATTLFCSRCKGEKPDEQFHHDSKFGSRRFRSYWCRTCKSSEARRNHVPKTDERSRHLSWVNRLRNWYGISEEDYLAMLRSQDFACAICGTPAGPSGRLIDGGKRLSVDHCHASGWVRGLLCNGCNTGIGYLCEDPARLDAAKEYLEKHSTPRLRRVA